MRRILFQKHIFYKELKNTKKDKANLFDEFEENLKCLDLNVIQDLITYLSKKHIQISNDFLLIYFAEMKKQSHQFVQLLQRMVA